MLGDTPWAILDTWPYYKERWDNNYLIKDGMRILKHVICRKLYEDYGIVSVFRDLSSNYPILPTENKNGHPGVSHSMGVGFDMAYPTVDNYEVYLDDDVLFDFSKMLLNCFPKAEMIVGPDERTFLLQPDLLGQAYQHRIYEQNDSHAFTSDDIFSHIHCWLHRGGWIVDWDEVNKLQNF